jgi:hypothetical protein
VLQPRDPALPGGALVAEHHLGSDVENDWNDPQNHVDPLVGFLKSVIAGSTVR